MLTPTAAFGSMPADAIVLSVVSHGHGALVQHLLHGLARLGGAEVTRVVLTQNLPEQEPTPPAGGWPFELQVRCNAVPQGFAANHNAALAHADEAFYAIVNPDVEWLGCNPFPALLQALRSVQAGLAYPLQLDAAGKLQDSEREVPTPWSLLQRYLAGRREMRAEWVNAAFWLVRREAWQTLGGFDTRYFMYCEDVDLCLRLRLAGWLLARADAVVEHAGQRDSHRRRRHALWHIRSLCRLWASPVFWRSRPLLRRMSAASLTMTE